MGANGKVGSSAGISVSEAAKLLGIAGSRLRYYERKGLVKPHRTASGYRLYSPEDIERLRTILLMRKFDMSIQEIKRALADPEFDPEKLLEEQVHVQRQRAKKAEELAGYAAAVRLTGIQPPEDILGSGSAEQKQERAVRRWNVFNGLRAAADVLPRFTPEGFADFNAVIADFAEQRGTLQPGDDLPQQTAARLFSVLCEEFIPIPVRLFRLLSDILAANGAASKDVDARNGDGTAAFAAACIRIWCEAQISQQEEPQD